MEVDVPPAIQPDVLVPHIVPIMANQSLAPARFDEVISVALSCAGEHGAHVATVSIGLIVAVLCVCGGIVACTGLWYFGIGCGTERPANITAADLAGSYVSPKTAAGWSCNRTECSPPAH